MVWRLTPSFSATSSWDRPLFLRARARLFPKLMTKSPFLILAVFLTASSYTRRVFPYPCRVFHGIQNFIRLCALPLRYIQYRGYMQRCPAPENGSCARKAGVWEGTKIGFLFIYRFPYQKDCDIIVIK